MLPSPFAFRYAADHNDREGTVYQVKAFIRKAKVTNRAVSARDALRLYREMQAGSGVTSCAVFQKGVLVSETELEHAARREQNTRI